MFSDVVVGSDLNENFGGSTDLAKKRHGSADLHTPIHPPHHELMKNWHQFVFCNNTRRNTNSVKIRVVTLLSSNNVCPINKLRSVFHASVMLLIMSWWKTDINLFFAITSGRIVCSHSLTHCMNCKLMCLSAYWHWKLVKDCTRISAVIAFWKWNYNFKAKGFIFSW